MNKPVITGNMIIVPSNTEHLADVDLFVEGILRGFGVDESTIADIAISVSELVNNAICHGNKLQEEKRVTVKVGKADSMVNISVSDQGSGFNPVTISDPLAEENLMKDVGRGVFIVKQLMDSVEITPSPEGTTVLIKKTIQ